MIVTPGGMQPGAASASSWRLTSAVEEQSIATKEIAQNVSQTATDAMTVSQGITETATASQWITRNITGLDLAARQTAEGPSQLVSGSF